LAEAMVSAVKEAAPRSNDEEQALREEMGEERYYPFYYLLPRLWSSGPVGFGSGPLTDEGRLIRLVDFPLKKKKKKILFYFID
jgi:hypothetical protein